MPLSAFDSRLNRVGLGGGFYDRYLNTNPCPNRLLVGVAFDEQYVGDGLEVPVEPTDVPLHFVITPTKLWRRPPPTV